MGQQGALREEVVLQGARMQQGRRQQAAAAQAASRREAGLRGKLEALRASLATSQAALRDMCDAAAAARHVGAAGRCEALSGPA